MKPYRILALLILLLLVGVTPTFAQDTIVPQPGVFTDPAWLRIDYQRVTVDIENQIATTNVDMQFTNEGAGLAEGTFVFPLPTEASVDQLTMYIDGVAIEARILPANEAREIYDEIVRQFRDPALLEYVGTNAIQANVFPIPPGDSRRIEISYSQVMEIDNGLIHYAYPLDNTRVVSSRQIDEMSVSVNVISNDPISNIYSPSHQIGVSRDDANNSFSAGFEQLNFVAGDDFSLYYGISVESININLLTYRESADQDGFFMLLVQPPLSIPEDQIIPKDVIIVLDQSGSMSGDKWEQAREAAIYVLENLNPEDRFNLITFSTGARMFSTELESVDAAPDAINWINNAEAGGGTDINLALQNAIDIADDERQTTVLFMTDGLATEGIIETPEILDNLQETVQSNIRIFTFGVGDNVDTFLLDSIVRDFRGSGTYVRTGERIEEEVASLYSKINSPVLTDISLDFGGVRTEWQYPTQLPDLFAGEQLTIVGRFRDDAENTVITLSGLVNGEAQNFVYTGMDFPSFAGGDSFIPRLWATRRIGDMLNSIRLNGENPELVDSIIDLSIRYGIITPYTSFLIEEDDILTQTGQETLRTELEEEAQELATTNTGSAAVDAADEVADLGSADAPAPMAPQIQATPGAGGDFDGETSLSDANDGTSYNAITTVNGKTFINLNGIWTDTTFEPDTMETTQIVFLSDEYFDLLDAQPELSDYFALGEQVIVVIEDIAYEVVSE